MGERTQTAQQQISIPAWLEDAAKGLTTSAVTESGRPLQQFPGSTIPGFNADQQGAFQTVRQNVGSWASPWSGALEAANNSGNFSQQDAIAPYLEQAGALSMVGAAQPYLNASAGMSGAGAASPLIAAASRGSNESVGDYMNPYNAAVTDRLGALAGRNLTENLLPGVNDTFTGAGQFGSGRHADFTGRVLRDTQESLLGAQASVLQSGYQGALSAAATDAARRAGLAGTVGSLTGADASRLLETGQVAGNLAGAESARLSNLANLASGATSGDRAAELQRSGALSSLGAQGQQLGNNEADALSRIGALQQAQQQAQLQEAEKRFNTQQGYGKEQLDWLNSIIRGTPSPSTTTTTSPGPNMFSQLGGLGLAAYGLFKRDGGRILARDGLYLDPDDYSDDEEEDPEELGYRARVTDEDEGPLAQATSTPAGVSEALPTGATTVAAGSGKTLDTSTPLGRAQAALMEQLTGIGARQKQAAEERRKATQALLTPDKAEDGLESRFASPLVQAGLAMAASKNPTLLGGVGEGGLAAAQSAQRRVASREASSLGRKKLALEAAKMEESAIGDELKGLGTMARTLGLGKGTSATSPLGKLKADLNSGLITPEEYKDGLKKLTQLRPEARASVDPVARLEADFKAGRIDEATYTERKKRLIQPLPAPIERAEDQGIGKANAERYNAYVTEGGKARKALDNIDATMILLDNVKSQGAAGPLLKQIASTLETFGIPPESLSLEKAAPGDAANALSNALIMSQLGSLGAGISNADRDFIQAQVMSIANTKGGNEIIAEVLRRQHRRAEEVAREARAYRKAGGDLAYLDDHISDKFGKTNLFDDSFREMVAEVSSTRAKPISAADRLKGIEAEIQRRREGKQ